MNMINVTLVGNLVKAPEQFCFPSGKIKTVMRIAVTNPARYNGNNSNNKYEAPESNTDFYRIEVWGKLAELAGRFLLKGMQVGVSGRLIMEHWVDKEGKERLTPVVAASQLQFPPRYWSNIASAQRKQISAASEPSSDSPVQNFEPETEDGDSDNFRSDIATSAELFDAARVLSIKEHVSSYSPFRASRRRA